jgi:hypothetical protein
LTTSPAFYGFSWGGKEGPITLKLPNLRRGLGFEEYDMAGIKTVNRVATEAAPRPPDSRTRRAIFWL